MAQIAADYPGISFHQIRFVSADTGVCPFDLGAYVFRQVFVSGNAVCNAAVQCKQKLLEAAGRQTGLSPGLLDLVDGVFYAGYRQGNHQARRGRYGGVLQPRTTGYHQK